MENLRRGRKRLNLERRIKWENVRRMLFTSVCFFILFFVAAGVVQIQKLHPIKPLFIWCAALLVETYAVIYGLISYLWLSKIKEIEMKKVLYLFWGTFLVLMAGFSFLVLDHFISLLIYLVASVILALVPLWNRQEFLVLFGMQIFVAAVLAYSKDLCLEEIVYLWANQLLCGIISRQGYYNFQQRMLDATRIDTAKLLSETDPMTQMLNRRGMEGVLNRIWPICEEKHTKVAVLMIDIDNFKKYNDCFGHPQGDCCIRKVSEQIQSITRDKMDFSARIGGEEFVVFLNGMEKDEALRCANTLKNRVEQLQITQAENNFLPFVTISIGVEWGNVRKGVTFDQLQEKADGFLYKAKEAGRACICMNGICHHRTFVQKNKRQYFLERGFRFMW